MSNIGIVTPSFHFESQPEQRDDSFEKELTALLNKHNKERGSNTPDYILAKHLCACLRAFDEAQNDRETWYGKSSIFQDAPLII